MYLPVVHIRMRKDQMGVSEIAILVGLIRKVVYIDSLKIGPVTWKLKLLMQILQRFTQFSKLKHFR